MATINFKHDGSEAPTWTPLPEGTYDFKIMGTEQRTSKAGNPTMQLKLQVIDPDSPQFGKNSSDWYTLTAKSGWKMTRLLDALGIPYDEIGKDDEGNSEFSFDDEDLNYRCVRLDVEQEEYPQGSGKMTNRFNNPVISDFDDFADEVRKQLAEEAAGDEGSNGAEATSEPEPPAEAPPAQPPTRRRRRPAPPASS